MTNENMKYTKIAKTTLSNKRYNHSAHVADMCVKLANVYGENPDTAYTAGILHDIRKETNAEVIKNEVIVSNLGADEIELVTPQLWHAIAGGYFVKTNLHIKNPDIINAIRFHTIGRGNMSKLEKIVYLGDLVSKDRSYSDVEKYRKYAFDNLDNAMFQAIKWSIHETMNKSGKIPIYTYEAYNFYLAYKI